ATANMGGSYVVTVTDANGCASGNVANVVVNPSLTINATNNGPICRNGTLNLTASSGISWVWTGPNGFGSFAQNPNIPNVQLPVSGTYVVVGTDANGCHGTDSTVVVINPLPTITANTATICVTQQTATLTANGGVSYVWGPSSTLSSGTGNPVTATPMVTTTYTIIGTDANGCVNSGVTMVTVNQLPTVTANSGVICFGNSTTLTGSGASTYSWTPSGSLSSATGNPVTASPASTTAYTVTGIDPNGCYNTGVCSVTVNALPNINSGSGTICFGATTVLNATGANTYSWSPATGLSATTGANVSASPASTTTYVVTGTDVNGCSNTGTAIVTVNPLPVLNVGPKITTGCSPVCVNFANASAATGTCSWNFGDGMTSTNCSPSHCYIGKGTYHAVLTLTDANGCVNSDTATTVVYPIPHADFYYGPQPTTIFESNITFTDASGGAVISTWNWAFGDPKNSTSNLQNVAFNYGNPGSYPVHLTVTSNYGCIDSITKIVVIDEDYMIYIPNAFSPNADGVNDFFFAKGEGVKDFKMYIFDRWGNQVFFSDDINKGWDGRFMGKGTDIVQEDVYVWKVELKNFKDEPHQLKGTVSLIK
ncbi:MAG TPA: PKD domain-containing protein, partial [Bacteroidia bacterium]|nr:PKD domain-containing protein [Bacteroidia bacterium]